MWRTRQYLKYSIQLEYNFRPRRNAKIFQHSTWNCISKNCITQYYILLVPLDTISSVLLAIQKLTFLTLCLKLYDEFTSNWTTQLTGLELNPEINKQIFNVAFFAVHVLLAAAIIFPSDSHDEKSKYILMQLNAIYKQVCCESLIQKLNLKNDDLHQRNRK